MYSIKHAIEIAKRTEVAKLVLLHHDPMRTDSQLDALTQKYCNSSNSGDTEVFFAREGMEIEL